MRCFIVLALLFANLSCTTGFCDDAVSGAGRKASAEHAARNHTYRLIEPDMVIFFKEGSFLSAGTTSNDLAASIAGLEIADLNDDGVPDAAVIIEHHGKGKPSVYELSVLIGNGKEYVQSKPVLLGEDLTFSMIAVEEARLFMPKRIMITCISGKMPDSPDHPAFEKKVGFYLHGNELKDAFSMEVVKKPALYLYPERKTTVEVRLGPKGRITKTIPDYKGKWTVSVDGKGRIERRYRYLFYEAELDAPIAQPQEGWCVRSSDLGKWMRSHLADLGLNRQESKDFMVYWLKNLPKSSCWIIRMIRPEVVDDQLGLSIRPEPQNLLRVLLHFTPSKEMVKLREPEIRRFERKGFVAVEWGGIVGSTGRKENVK